MSAREVVVVPDRDALADTAAAHIEEVLLGAAGSSEPASVALAGGPTPEVAYRHLASRPVPWRRLQIFFSDERCVPPEDERSNYRLAERAILERIPLKPFQVHRIRGEIDPERAAIEAEAAMRDNLPGRLPRLDLVMLGMGTDGQVASLIPGGSAVETDDRLYVHVPRGEEPGSISVTLPVINAAKHVAVVVADGAKAPAVAAALERDPSLPAGRIAPEDGALTWILTDAAASET